MAQGAYAFMSPVATTDLSKPFAKRDPLLNGDNGGVRVLFDLAFGFSYPGGALASRSAPGAPADSAAVYDIAERGNLVFQKQAGETIDYAGGGFDFSAATKGGAFIKAPTAAGADIWGPGAGATATAAITGNAVSSLTLTAGGSGYNTEGTTDGVAQVVFSGGGGSGAIATATVVGGVVTALNLINGGTGYASAPTVTIVPAKQYFLLATYAKLPSEADWNTGAAARSFFNFGNFGTDQDLAVAYQYPTKSLQWNRQRAGGSDNQQLAITTAHFGQLAQIAVWRGALTTGMRVRTSAGILVVSGASSAIENPSNWSARALKWGLPDEWWGTGALNAAALNASNYRLYRGWLENLRRSGRDPITVLDDDWARVAARGGFT